MQSALYVSLSAQMALDKRMATIANNVANMGTAGFRADAVKFETAMSQAAKTAVAFSTPGEDYIARNAGAVTKTGNPLDVAVVGEGWLAFQSQAGTVYTRDGRMQITAEGELHTMGGHQVLDAGGAPILLDPEGGNVAIARDGMITQNNRQVGAIGLFEIPQDAKLRRFENSGVIPDRPVTAVVDFVNAGVMQGYAEGSNVNPMLEMTKLITASRTFQSATSMIESSESTLSNAIRTLGEPTKA